MKLKIPPSASSSTSRCFVFMLRSKQFSTSWWQVCSNYCPPRAPLQHNHECLAYRKRDCVSSKRARKNCEEVGEWLALSSSRACPFIARKILAGMQEHGISNWHCSFLLRKSRYKLHHALWLVPTSPFPSSFQTITNASTHTLNQGHTSPWPCHSKKGAEKYYSLITRRTCSY